MRWTCTSGGSLSTVTYGDKCTVSPYKHSICTVRLCRWITFDGNVPHRTLPFEGTRYSLVYFTASVYTDINAADRSFAVAETAFPWPAPGQAKRAYPPASERLAAGKAAYREWSQAHSGGQ